MYVHVSEGVPTRVTLQYLRENHPNVSFPKEVPGFTLAEYNVFPVVQQPDPVYDPNTQRLIDGTPVEVAGVWQVTSVAESLPAEEIARRAAQNQASADKAVLKGDAQVAALLKARPNQIDNYIETNVTNLSSAKDVLKILARAVAVLSESTLR
jgi:hypothetical protein